MERRKRRPEQWIIQSSFHKPILAKLHACLMPTMTNKREEDFLEIDTMNPGCWLTGQV